jgi:hypothetical protein
MSRVMPAAGLLPFPETLIDRELDLEKDFGEAPSGAAHAPDGRLFIASQLFYNAFRYGEPSENDVELGYLTAG